MNCGWLLCVYAPNVRRHRSPADEAAKVDGAGKRTIPAEVTASKTNDNVNFTRTTGIDATTSSARSLAVPEDNILRQHWDKEQAVVRKRIPDPPAWTTSSARSWPNRPRPRRPCRSK